MNSFVELQIEADGTDAAARAALAEAIERFLAEQAELRAQLAVLPDDDAAATGRKFGDSRDGTSPTLLREAGTGGVPREGPRRPGCIMGGMSGGEFRDGQEDNDQERRSSVEQKETVCHSGGQVMMDWSDSSWGRQFHIVVSRDGLRQSGWRHVPWIPPPGEYWDGEWCATREEAEEALRRHVKYVEAMDIADRPLEFESDVTAENIRRCLVIEEATVPSAMQAATRAAVGR